MKPNPDADAFARRLFDPAFVDLVRRASAPVFPLELLSRRSDLIEEALVKAYRRRKQFRGTTDAALLGWVLTILENLTRDVLRAEKDRPGIVSLPIIEVADFRGTDADDLRDDPRDIEDRRTTPDDDKPQDPARAAMLEAMERLRPDEREVLLLRIVHEYTARETAAALSTPDHPVSEAAVKMRFRRAMDRLLVLLEETCLGPELWKTGPDGPETAA